MRTIFLIATAAVRTRLSTANDVTCKMRVMPWDVGVGTLKSDRYFAAAEAAQFDYLTRTGTLLPMLRGRIRWVNLAQASVLQRPLKLLQRFSVTTRVDSVDNKHVYFSHTFSSEQGNHAVILVKAKFKRAGITVHPESILGPQAREKSATVQALDALSGGSLRDNEQQNAGLLRR